MNVREVFLTIGWSQRSVLPSVLHSLSSMPDPGAHPPAACSEPSACPQSCRAAGEEISGSVSRTEYYIKNWYSVWLLAIWNMVSYPVRFCSEFAVFLTQKVAFTFILPLQSTRGLIRIDLPVGLEIVLELLIDIRFFFSMVKRQLWKQYFWISLQYSFTVFFVFLLK